MDPIMTAFLWAVFGAISYKFISTIFRAGQYTLFAKKIVYHSLVLLVSVVEDLAFMRELKYSQMNESDMSGEQIKLVKKVDEQILNIWKNNSIKVFKNSFPTPLESIVKFNTWQEAMNELNKMHRGE